MIAYQFCLIFPLLSSPYIVGFIFISALLYIFYADCWNDFLYINPPCRVFIGQAATQGKLLLWGAKVRLQKKL